MHSATRRLRNEREKQLEKNHKDIGRESKVTVMNMTIQIYHLMVMSICHWLNSQKCSWQKIFLLNLPLSCNHHFMHLPYGHTADKSFSESENSLLKWSTVGPKPNDALDCSGMGNVKSSEKRLSTSSVLFFFCDCFRTRYFSIVLSCWRWLYCCVGCAWQCNYWYYVLLVALQQQNKRRIVS